VEAAEAGVQPSDPDEDFSIRQLRAAE
jgi:hypothetical protein